MAAEPFEDRCRQAGAVAQDLGASALLASDPATVRWLTGRQAEIEFGPPHPIWAGTHVLLRPDGRGSIICPGDASDAGPPVQGLDVATYEAYTLGPLQPYANAAAMLGGANPLAVEPDALSVSLVGGRPWVDATDALRALRVRKDDGERAAIARTAVVVSAGQQTFREVALAGLREIDVFSEVHAAMERTAGVRVPVLPDLLSGPRLMEVGRPPTDRVIGPDELALCDLSARFDGYWADSCTTICVGRPTAEMRRLHDGCRRALDAGIAAARPGTLAGQLDALLRGMMADLGYEYPHHSGHAVGVSYHEEPRIVPGSEARLEEGMVIALEPAGFGNGIGCRIEHLMIVTSSGGDLLTDYETRLER
jgi:Xaa-Pro aminopeptidase